MQRANAYNRSVAILCMESWRHVYSNKRRLAVHTDDEGEYKGLLPRYNDIKHVSRAVNVGDGMECESLDWGGDLLLSCPVASLSVSTQSTAHPRRTPGLQGRWIALHPVRWTWRRAVMKSGRRRSCGWCVRSRWRRGEPPCTATTDEHWGSCCSSTTDTSSRPILTSTVTSTSRWEHSSPNGSTR